MWPAARPRGTAATLLVLLLLFGTARSGLATPARFWFSLSQQDPYRFALAGPSGIEPGIPQVNLALGTSVRLHLWAQPQTADLSQSYHPENNPFLSLQNVSLNVDMPATAGGVCIDRVSMHNPSGERFGTVVDSANPAPINVGNQIITYPLFDPSGVERFAGFTVGQPTNLTGSGDNCANCEFGLPQSPLRAMRLGSIEVRGTHEGAAIGHLQVGSLAISHQDESNPSITQVVFGTDFGPNHTDVIYSANDDRNRTVGNDTPDFNINVVATGSVIGDYNGNVAVDAADYTFWRDKNPLADGNSDSNIDALDYDIWRSNYGVRPQTGDLTCHTGGAGSSVPEPAAIVWLFLACVLITMRPRSTRQYSLALVVCVALGVQLQTERVQAQVTSIWDMPISGDWDFGGNWNNGISPGFSPGGMDTAIIDQVGGSYTVDLGVAVELLDLSLASPDATLDVLDTTITIDNQLEMTAGTLLLNGAPSIVDNGSATLLNQGAITTAGAGTKTIDISQFDNQGSVSADAGTLSLRGSTSWDNTGSLHVGTGAVLEIRSADFDHTGTALLTGSGTVRVDSDDNGSFNFLDVFTNAARISSGSSPGTLTIDGNYTQTSAGVLEMEIPGDELVVTGTATLGGRLDILAGDQLANFGGTFTVVSASSLVGNFENYHMTGLGPLPIGIRLDYSGTALTATYAFTASRTFASGSSPMLSDWNSTTTWGGSTVPDSLSVVSLSNTGASPQTVEITTSGSPINAAHSLAVGGGTGDMELSIVGESLSVSTTSTITTNGTIELTGDGALLSTEFLNVEGGGTFTGIGKLIGEVEVGSAGSGDALFDPVGTLTLSGNFTQNAIGKFAAEVPGTDGGQVHDRFVVQESEFAAGDVTLAGTLEIDATDLTLAEFSSGDTYEIIVADGAITGQFDSIEIIGRDDIYFHVEYNDGGAPAQELLQLGGSGSNSSGRDNVTLAGYFKGDADQDGDVDKYDARIFAEMLLDNDVEPEDYTDDQNRLIKVDSDFFDVFDFVDLTTTSSTDIVDFFDIPGFAQAMATHGSLTLGEAYAVIETAMLEAHAPRVPEPGTLLIAAATFCGVTFRRRAR